MARPFPLKPVQHKGPLKLNCFVALGEQYVTGEPNLVEMMKIDLRALEFNGFFSNIFYEA